MRVLIADDNAVVRIGLAAVLRRLDSVDEIVEAVDGVDALDKVRTHAPDIVLLDVRMPRKDGLAVLEELAGSVPALMLTHSEEPDIVRMALDLGARGYLVHGATSPEEIGSALQTCLAGGLVLSASAVGALHAPPAGEPEPAPPHPFTELLTERELDVLSAAAAGQTSASASGSVLGAPAGKGEGSGSLRARRRPRERSA